MMKDRKFDRPTFMLRSAARLSLIRIRWRIFCFLFGFGFLAYFQHLSITVAADRMMPELGLSQFQIGLLVQAFIVGYAIFQTPGGVFGQRVGARRTFVIIGLIAFFATVATPLAPYVMGGMGLFVMLLSIQFLLGTSQAAIFPVSAGVFETWFPPDRWSFVQGLQTMGLGLGAALTPPLVATLTSSLGWQQALLWTSLPALALIGLWAWYGRNSPREHPSVSAEELAEIGARGSVAVDSHISFRKVMRLFRDRNVFLLAVSYMCMNYSFYLLSTWVFLYLIQERKFSSLESGWLAMAPPLAAAAGAGIGGWVTGMMCKRLGDRWGYRSVPLVALPAAGVLLLVAISAANPYAAVFVLALCFGFVELTEGAYWGAAMTVGRGDTMAISGFMNTGGNLGGIIGTPIVAYLSGHHMWRSAFIIGTGFAFASAIAWLGIKAEAVVDAEPARGAIT
jgi:ACS family glucarate transporter-like MFS transporter